MNVLLIGFGSIGKRHDEILSNLDGIDRIDLVTKQTVPDRVCYTELEQVRHLHDYDYFIIASETVKHYQQLHYLQRRVRGKKILVEKPLFAHPERIDGGDNNVFVAYNLRFHPILQQIKTWTEDTKVLSVNCTAGQYLPEWRPGSDYRRCYSADKDRGGGVLRDLSHELDYLQWLFGRITDFFAINEKLSDLEITSADFLSLLGKTEKGTQITLNLDYLNRIPTRQLNIQTSNSSIKADLVNGTLTRKADSADPEILDFKNQHRNTPYQKMHQSILSPTPGDTCTTEEGLITVQLIDTIEQKAGWKKQKTQPK